MSLVMRSRVTLVRYLNRMSRHAGVKTLSCLSHRRDRYVGNSSDKLPIKSQTV